MIDKKENNNQVVMEFHVSRSARDRYQFDQALFSQSGNIVFANFHAARVFAQKMNQKRDLVNFPEQAVQAGQINAMGLIDEMLHLLLYQYRQQRNPQVMDQAYQYLETSLGSDDLEKTLLRFTEEFPPLAVYRQEVDLEDFLAGTTGDTPNRLLALEEMLMLWLANLNPAFSPFLELFTDDSLKKNSAYNKVFTHLRGFFDTQPSFGPDDQSLIDILRAPALTVPHSLSGQLEFMRRRWVLMIGKYLYRILSSLDLIKEEGKAVFWGPGPARIVDFTGQETEPEQFSPDKDWMPSLVLIAKNAYVWLDQISKKYNQPVSRLDEIPDEELDMLSQAGFTGLWLIGLWERSPASKHIKQLRGNPEAVASAYSLFAYDIAADLGGEEAYRTLRDKAWKRGIRLASDMVPNHMGVDSRWVIEHPDWFISLDHSPFPTYTFNGPNLSWDSRVGLYIEDHYFDNTDAAVVFKRTDFWTGQEKYIYHGNDGTSMPWNDTAQLNYLNPEVREAVIQTILHVARKFPVIRFDAAMTLAKRHFHRLWYPEPGSGGDIPSRAEFGLTKEQFDAAIPVEFWREVVDRVAQEVPDTLLLAEAFWLMEGYFVRTLGMHRVYNSAFMNMLRDEKNQEYRLVIKNTLEFDPEILKRYVNFMNNPDERTAVDQFGKGDKYFGISTLLATLPGLPMFGHGQIEGFTEKYGMEYRRAYWDEQPDEYLMQRHQREIFPLLRQRHLFAEASDFLLYDFYTPEGQVNEDVFAYSNRSGENRALIIYHNKYANTRGWIRISAAYPVKTGQGDERALIQKSLGEGLGLHCQENMFIVFKDHISGLEYLHSCQDFHDRGLYLSLDAYRYHVFLDFTQVQDNEWGQYAQLAQYLDGRGVPSVEEALKELLLKSILLPYAELVNSGQIQWLIDNRVTGEAPETPVPSELLDEIGTKAQRLLDEVSVFIDGQGENAATASHIRRQVAALLKLPVLEINYPFPRSRKYKNSLEFLFAGKTGKLSIQDGDPFVWGTLFSWLITRQLGEMTPSEQPLEVSRAWVDEWLLGKIITRALQDLGEDEDLTPQAAALVKLLITHSLWAGDLKKRRSKAAIRQQAYQVLYTWLQDNDVQRFIGVNRFKGVLWFNKEAYDEWLWWMFATAVLHTVSSTAQPQKATEQIVQCFDLIQALKVAEGKSQFQLDRLLTALKS